MFEIYVVWVKHFDLRDLSTSLILRITDKLASAVMSDRSWSIPKCGTFYVLTFLV